MTETASKITGQEAFGTFWKPLSQVRAMYALTRQTAETATEAGKITG